MSKINFREVLDYKKNPELWYQSYEDLVNDGKELKDEYIANRENGSSKRIVLTNTFLRDNYAKKNNLSGCRISEFLKLDVLEKKILEGEVNGLDKITRTALLDLLRYRKKEYEMINLFSSIPHAEHKSEARAAKSVAAFLNEFLYGAIDIKILYSALYEILVRNNNKQDFKGNVNFLNLSIEINSRLTKLLGSNWMQEVESSHILPRLTDESKRRLKRYINENFAEIREAVESLWKEKSDALMQEKGEKYQAEPKDIVEFFELALSIYDPKGKSGVRVLLDKDLSGLSWSGERRAVIVGAKRSPIKSVKVLFGKIIHELLVHGQRAVRGEQIHPILGIGLFGSGSYLDFEEGLAVLLEKISQDGDMIWEMSSVGLYINVALAAFGACFDEIYEINWRLRVLELMNKGKYSEENVATQKKNAYDSVVRVFRGVPMDKDLGEDDIKLFYGKDMAYLAGKVKVIRYVNERCLRGELDLNKVLMAKFDPTNEEHMKIIDHLSHAKEK